MKDCPRHRPDCLVIGAIPANDATAFFAQAADLGHFDQDRRGGNCTEALDALDQTQRTFAGWTGFQSRSDCVIEFSTVIDHPAQPAAGQLLCQSLLLSIQLVLEPDLVFDQRGAGCL